MALSANAQRPVRLESMSLATEKLPMAAIAETIYKGSLVISDVSADDGYFRALASGTAAAGDVFGGVALEQQSITTADADGDVEVTVARNGIWGFPVGSVAITDIGAPAYATDDDTITITSTNNMWVGYIVGIDATYVWVDIAPAWMRANSAT